MTSTSRVVRLYASTTIGAISEAFAGSITSATLPDAPSADACATSQMPLIVLSRTRRDAASGSVSVLNDMVSSSGWMLTFMG
ncbi:MAG: hypothetical protein ACXVUL_21305 [Solirubrobacteraceae bacterium]